MSHLKSKLDFLVGVSLKRKIKTKWFIVANVLIGLAVISLANIDSIVKAFGGDFNEKPHIYVIDDTGYSYDLFAKQINSIGDTSNLDELKFEVELFKEDIKSATDKIGDSEKDLIIAFSEDKENYLKVEVISKGYIDSIDFQLITNAINGTKSYIALNNEGIKPETITDVYKPATIIRTFLDENKSTKDEKMTAITTTVFPLFILPFFMLTIFLVQMIGAEVNDEKTTRGMEIIISNVSPKTHFFAKVIAGNLFVLIQGILLFSYGLIAFLIRSIITPGKLTGMFGDNISDLLSSVFTKEFTSQLIYIIPLTLILMILTFIAYSIIAGVLASMTTNIEDYQQLQTPIIIISLIGYYLSMMAGMFEGALFIRVLSYVPLVSAILSPSLLVLGQIGITDVIISIGIMIITNYYLYTYGLKIYKIGILNYSSSKLWHKMFKAVKE